MKYQNKHTGNIFEAIQYNGPSNEVCMFLHKLNLSLVWTYTGTVLVLTPQILVSVGDYIIKSGKEFTAIDRGEFEERFEKYQSKYHGLLKKMYERYYRHIVKTYQGKSNKFFTIRGNYIESHGLISPFIFTSIHGEQMVKNICNTYIEPELIEKMIKMFKEFEDEKNTSNRLES